MCWSAKYILSYFVTYSAKSTGSFHWLISSSISNLSTFNLFDSGSDSVTWSFLFLFGSIVWSLERGWGVGWFSPSFVFLNGIENENTSFHIYLLLWGFKIFSLLRFIRADSYNYLRYNYLIRYKFSVYVFLSCENELKRLEHSFRHPSENGRTPILDRVEIL